ncbi:DUF2306 domain-containing protein [Bradyrhizobium sp. CIAT3101]|uniref:DUF2306 domain-containing protein n=1 Tax=Bradyrhizobium sp. CIAT3101 TaxID=439387 RepID=UPI0024B138F8|nr:DUF2306 domain-containing protein [Bradyrhizobium sp. CIAT3101]WFU82333.1 DUF2306 domain-containing protein [Bradyrhizobium sp. CIAT3101]
MTNNRGKGPRRMHSKYIPRLGRGIIAALAAIVTAHSLRYYATLGGVWFGIDPNIKAVILQAPLQALTHMLIAPVALLLGPLQFVPRLRARHPTLHRYSGRVYVLACVLAGAGALATTPFASGGEVAGLGFGILAVLWIGTTVAAWVSAVRARFEWHRILMRFSYAMTFGAVVLRLQIPIGYALGYSSYSSMSPILSFTSWLPNVLIVALYSTLEARRHPPRSASASRPASRPS